MKTLSSDNTVQFVDALIFEQTNAHLTDIQAYILRESLQHKQYSAMTCYDLQYVKNEGAKLWKLLSTTLGEKLTKHNFQATLTRHWQARTVSRQDWGEAPNVPYLFGRNKALETLEQWIVGDRCQVVAILGMAGVGKTRLSVKLGQGDNIPIKLGKGGIGKTDLSLRLAQGIQDQFDYVIWRRLLNSPSLLTIIQDCILFFSNHQDIDVPATEDQQISRLLHYFKRHRCLLILDNLETILMPEDSFGLYREGYEGYGKLLERIGESPHQSCLLLTSRETPKNIEHLEGQNKPVRFYHLGGLSTDDGKAIFQEISQFQGAEEIWEQLVHYYNGNPLALELAAHHIQHVSNGDISQFWSFQKPLFHEIKELLSWHFQRLTELEEEVLFLLAVNRDPVTPEVLYQDLVSVAARDTLQETLKSLRHKLPLEVITDLNAFTLHPVLMEYVTGCLIQQMYHEILTGEIEQFNRYYLLKAQASDYIKASQSSLILAPIIKRLHDDLHSTHQIEERLQQILHQWRFQFPHRPGYLAGNILNLLCHLNADLSGYDFSQIAVWQADLQGQILHRVNFAQADFKHSMFTKAFGGIHAVAFRNDSKVLAVGDSHGKLRLMSVDDTQTLAISDQSHKFFVTSMTFNSDSTRLVSSAMETEVLLWAVTDSELTCLKTLTGHIDWVWHAIFSPDDRWIATASDDATIRLWDAETGECYQVLTGHQGWVVSVAFHPHLPLLASSSTDGTVRFWDLHSGDCVDSLEAHKTGVWQVVYSPDAKILVTGGWDKTIKLWDAQTKNCLNTLIGHQNPVKNLLLSPDSKMLVSAAGISQVYCKPTIKLWDVATGTCIHTFQGHQSGIRSLTLSPDQKTIASGDIEQTVKFWDVKTGKSSKTISGHTAWIWTLAFSPDGQLLASGGLDHQIRLWDTKTRTCLQELSGHGAWVWNVIFSAQGQYLASSSDDQTVRLWDYAASSSAVCHQVLNASGTIVGGIWSMACSPDGCLIATSGQSSTIRLWDTKSGNFIQEIGDHAPYWIWSLDFSPDGQFLASASDDRTVKIWHVATGQLLHTLHGHTHKIHVVRFSSNGQFLASGGEDTVARIWNAETGNCVKQLTGYQGWIWDIAVSPDCRSITCGGSDGIYLWSMNGDTNAGTSLHRNDYVTALAFHPQHPTLASGSMNGSIKLWDIQYGKYLTTLSSPRPYKDMNIMNVTGLTASQKLTLNTLGAIN